jgi:PDZ domain-containing secreted protein
VKARKNELGITNIISGYKEMKDGEKNPAIGKLFIDDRYVAINNNLVHNPKEIGEEVISKKRGEKIWVIVSRKLDNDIKDKEDKSKLSSAICISGSESISGKNINCKDIISRYGKAYNILKKNINKDISI